MTKEYKTVRDCTELWMGEFDAIPTGMVSELMAADPDAWQEVTWREEDEVFDLLPMWGTMWSFHDPCDIWWVEEGDGVEVLSLCGFRVYEHERYGFFFGIDGAGYDFYDAHWCPLYHARGLRWHEI